MALTKLILSTLTTRKVRTALTVAAVALAVSLVVAVTTGYTSAEGAIYKYLATYMGATDVQVINHSDWRKGMSASLVGLLRNDPDIVNIFGRLETDTGILDKDGKVVASPAAELIGVDRPADDDVTRTPIQEGDWFDRSSGDVAVIDQKAAENMKVRIGDSIILPSPSGKRTLKVVGICHKPAFFAERVQSIYVPLQTAQQVTGRGGDITRIMIRLKSATLDQSFASRWETRLKASHPELKLRLARDTRKEMDKNLEGVHFLSILGGAVSLLSAAFIVFTTLSMGVAERQRTLAMLRAIGAYRGQIARLVLAEAAWLALMGSVIGVPLGLFWAWLLAIIKSDFFTAGVIISGTGIWMGILGTLITALIAGILPAWSASRVSPLEAMTPLAKPSSLRTAMICAIAGFILVSIDYLMINHTSASREAKFYTHFAIGLPALMLGFFLLSPLFVWLVDQLLSRVCALVLGIQPRLLRHQLSGGLWRAAGTGAALMVGLSILVVMQSVGHSLLNGWKLPTKFPDIFIWTTNARLKATDVSELERVKGIRKGEVTPLVIGIPGLPQGFFSLAGAAVLPDATMYVGVDPANALDMMELEFREGTSAQAKQALLKGGAVIITEEFRVLKNLHVGDKLPLMTRSGLHQFDICGVVWSPGIDVMVSMFDLRGSIEQRSAMTVFGSMHDAKKYFNWDQADLFAANLTPGVEREGLLKQIKQELGEKGWKAGDVRHIKANIEKGFYRMLLLLTFIAFASMAVAALGVTNTVMASVRSRQWQFGVLRSIGVTRSQLLRLVLAEAALLGLVGSALGLAAGFLMSLNAMGLSQYILGYITPLTPPWHHIGIGVGSILLLSLLASLWPATHVARTQPLSLLQSGRAAI